jgi:hypothetical protein
VVRRGAVLLSLIVSSGALTAAPKLNFDLAVLRRDGIMIPFAAFNGHEWSTPWPTSDENVALPIALDDVPKKWWGPETPSAVWTAWMVSDGSHQPLKLEKPAQVRVFCGGHIGVKTNYTGESVDERAPSVPKDALVVGASADAVPVEPILAISLYSQDAARVVKSITDEFNKQEAEAVKRFTNWVHPYSAKDRAAMPIELEAFYRSREKTTKHGEWLVSYVEAIRRFPAGPFDKDCGLITWVRGWVIEREGNPPELHLTARVTYCDREGVSFMQPLGHLSIDGENYWVYQMSSWRDEVYTVARIADAGDGRRTRAGGPDDVRPILNIFGGGCPKDAVK